MSKKNKSNKNVKPVQMIRMTGVVELTSLSKPYIYKLMNAGKFPQSIKLGDRAVGWIKTEVDEWIADRIKASRKGA